MVTYQISEVIQHIRRTVLLRDEAGLTDGQLLDDYLSHRSQEALAALVRRHSPMVWGVCSRALWNYHDAEDAFQATFLVLVRRAASIASRELLANWLYGVAHQTALKARATVARKTAKERQVTEMPEPEAVDNDHWHDLQPLLDQELSRLPDKYRVVVILCDLDGKTRKEAARQLGVPEGTVAGRLARARVILAKRLTRHGLALSGGTLVLALSEKSASAAVPPLVLASTIKAATSIAAGQAAGVGVISARVAALTERVVRTMLLSKTKTLLAVLLVLMVAWAGLYMDQAGAQQRPADKSTAIATKYVGKAEKGDPKALPARDDPPKAKADDPSAKQIVDRMAKAYTDCKTYRDSGVVKTLFVEQGGNRTVEKPFTTAFVRPDRFRFEYQETVGDQQMRYIISSNEKEIQTWWDVKPGIEKPESLNLALGAAVGVSSFSSNNIPALLLPDKVNPRRLLMLTEPKRAEDAKQDKVECFRVEGTFAGNPITLWIDKKSYLVRRIDEQAKFDNFRTEQTTTYDPAINEKITDKMLVFDPPAPK